MFPIPRDDLEPNTAAFERLPLVKPTGFREYDARWRYPDEVNLMGMQAIGLGLATLLLLGSSSTPRPDDLAQVRARGELRVLLPRQDSTAHLPRSGRPLEAERAHAAAFARELGVSVVWTYVETFDDLLQFVESYNAALVEPAQAAGGMR